MALALLGATSATAQPAPGAAPPTYVTLADLTLAAPVIVRATITRSQRINPSDAAGLAPGMARQLLTARVDGALTATAAVPPELVWLHDVPQPERGRAPDQRGQQVLAWLQPPDAEGKTVLMPGPSMQPWSAPLEATVRAIATQAVSGTVPIVTGVSNGFRVPGTVPGEAESQFFLTTKGGKPLTMVVLDRPGQRRQIQVASSDIIDESATSVAPETLLWYRLACALPGRLPASAGGSDPALAAAWASAIASLGPCTRP
ncbi:hypothetical protein GCM10007973_09480 [Polymorphobacter multimanifer]|uniref:Uncharacterized protein n=1 Tax=Polymorphobacter multimanifer TaxID=1070431 RepID=A0A841LF46_9SPHN|nr:hypothetical protein [Polymorphobacter multimanifer]MBB6228435.1 hypothetical protein [Polymorphobacter multimanifer]GGI74703.1 hypothetical protein GCM10007973_09480 [Polymorphobacter multimanifer]